MKILTRLTIGALGVAALMLASCHRSGGGKAELTVAGSTSVQPFMEMLAESYMAKDPTERVIVQGGGSTAGIQAVGDGAAALGMSSRELTSQEKETLTPVVIAHDGIAVVVHSSNPVENLTLAQVRDIFAGKVRNWKEVGGRGAQIWPVTREEGSGTRGAFTEMVMHKTPISGRDIVQASNGAVRAVIADLPDGIGYISLGLVDESVKAIRIDGVKPVHENLRNKSYRLVRPFLLVLKGEPREDAKRFMDYVLGDQGQKQLEEESLIGAR